MTNVTNLALFILPWLNKMLYCAAACNAILLLISSLFKVWGHTLLFLNSNFEIFKGTVNVISKDLLIKNVEDTVVFFYSKIVNSVNFAKKLKHGYFQTKLLWVQLYIRTLPSLPKVSLKITRTVPLIIFCFYLAFVTESNKTCSFNLHLLTSPGQF